MFLCFLIIKYQCKNMICLGQHTVITFATAHRATRSIAAVTVMRDVCDWPVIATAIPTSTARFWATLLFPTLT